jgi:hypothetical protein
MAMLTMQEMHTTFNGETFWKECENGINADPRRRYEGGWWMELL